MAKKKRSEIVPAKELDALVRRHVAEALAFEPWFRPRSETATMRARQTIPERQKWSAYYARWGCLACHRKTGAYGALGLCQRCRNKIYFRLQSIVRELAAEYPAGRTREEVDALDKPTRTARALLLGEEER
jgi:hypothetical protein